MSRKLLFTLVVSSCIIAAFATALASAEELRSPRANREESNDGWDSSERKYKYDLSGLQFSASGGYLSKDLGIRRGIRFQGKMDSQGLRLYARFFNRESDSVAMYSVKIRVRDLIEYIPAASNATGYTSGDTVVRSMTSGWTWKPVQDTTNSGSSSSFAREFTITTQNGAFSAVVKFNIPDNSSLGASANDMKIDFIINNEALKAAGWLTDNSSLIALKGVIQSDSNLAHRHANVSDEVEGVEVSSSSSSVAAFQWTNFIMCNGRKITVATSKLIDDSSNPDNKESDDEDDHGSSRANVVYWSFLNEETANGNETCIWDPVVKMQSAASHLSAFGLLLFLASVLSVLLL